MTNAAQVWWLRAHPGYFEGTSTGLLAEVYSWTALAGMRRGDRVVLYANRDQEFRGIARCVHDAVRVAPREYWVHLQYLGAPTPVPLVRTKLPTPNQGRGQRLSEEHAQAILKPLLSSNSNLRRRWRSWERGSRIPGGYDPAELRDAELRDPPKAAPRLGTEKELEEQIRNLLIKRGVARDIRDRDSIDLSETKHLLDLEGYSCFPDLVMPRPDTRRLMLIEVKLVAGLSPDRNGVNQIQQYRPALRRCARGWTVESYVIARRIPDSVLRLMPRANVIGLEWTDGRRPTLVHRGGHKPVWLSKL